MLIPVHQLCGELLSALSDSALLLPLDLDSVGILDSALGAGDWTYLQIKQGATYEIVKVISVDAGEITIEREIDGTSASEFLEGAQVTFILCTSAIADIILDRQLANITITGGGAIEVVENSPGDYTLSAPEFVLTGAGKVVVTGDYETGYEVSATAPLGCCEDEL